MKISVVVPVYNVAPFLPRCLDSLLGQTHRDLEILCVNDGSTDASPGILRDYEEKDARVRVLTKENGGLSDARNFGIDRARGEVLAFVDGDDAVSPDFCEKICGAAEDGAELVLFDFSYVSENGVRERATLCRFFSDPVRGSVTASPMACCRAVKRETLGDARFPLGTWYEDLAFCPSWALLTRKIAYLREPLYDYYQRGGSIMNQGGFDPRMEQIFSALEALEARFEAAGRRGEFQKELEYLSVEHLLRSAALRLAPLPEGRELFARLGTEMKKKYPDWKKNPYRKKAGLPFRLLTRLSFGGHWRLVRLLARLKGRG